VLSVTVGNGKVGVGEDVVQARRIAGERAGVGEQFFLGVAQRVRGAAKDVRQVEAVDLQARLGGDERRDRRLTDLQQLGSMNDDSALTAAASWFIS
jgi:hypothetical protein